MKKKGGSSTHSGSPERNFNSGLVLGTLEFEAYTEDIVEVMDKHDMNLYADDTQLLYQWSG